jgi:hydroxymethylpyrimidine/phosphomethylpyrimidine kinase
VTERTLSLVENDPRSGVVAATGVEVAADATRRPGDGSTPPVALTIAGSDSGGGAGIQADLRTFAAFGVHGCTAIAALTAQNTHEVRGVRATDPGFLREQIEAVLDDLPVVAVKTGMLATAANVRVVAALAAAGRLPNLVVDPVMVSSSGDRLLDDDAIAAYRDELFPHALVITPNSREAAALLGWTDPIVNVDEQHDAAEALARQGARHVMVKGGDVEGVLAADVLSIAGDEGYFELTAPRIATTNNHGTGCSLASAIAALLACGSTPQDAIEQAKDFVHQALSRAVDWHLGAGHGPIDHLDFAHPLVLPTERTIT